MPPQDQLLPLEPAGAKHTHYLFRYPAKFHPPVVRALIDRFTDPGQVFLDNFCGSGTSLVEASVMGRRSVGLDIDPVATRVSRAKTHRYTRATLTADVLSIETDIDVIERPEREYDLRTFDDLSADDYAQAVAEDGLWVPAIPRLDHWFRRYVTVDLARIHQAIRSANVSEDSRSLMFLAFASIIRNVSNADPVPVSGLEVTSHMLKRDAEGRRINPVEQFRVALRKASQAVLEYSDLVVEGCEATVFSGDATSLPGGLTGPFDAIITSPPYHNAVDYYRRHQLEMFWLGEVTDQKDRLALLPHYVGRHRIPAKHTILKEEWSPPSLTAAWMDKIGSVDSQRASDFRHYMASMGKVFREMAAVLKPEAPAVLVVGESAWQGEQIPTAPLLEEIASQYFCLAETYWYPIKNRYMSYARHNGADIGQEHVLVFRRH